jgi:RNA polymerase sigma-70 factor (ECF subfamily)
VEGPAQGLAPASDDERLAASAAAGDASAFDALVHRYQARAYGLAYRLLGPDGEPEDAVQEAFLQVLRGLPSFRGDARFSTWLFRVVTNAALMQRRSRARRVAAETLEPLQPSFDEDGMHARTPAELSAPLHLEDQLDRQVLARRAAAGLDRLPDAYRTPFILRDLEELPTAEVAALLDLEPATVRQRVHRARLMIREYLAGLAGEKKKP